MECDNGEKTNSLKTVQTNNEEHCTSMTLGTSVMKCWLTYPQAAAATNTMQRNVNVIWTTKYPLSWFTVRTATLYRNVPCMGHDDAKWNSRHDVTATTKVTGFQSRSVHVTNASTNNLRVHCNPRLQMHFSVTTRNKYWICTGAMIAQQPFQLSRVGETKGNAAMTGNYFAHSRVNELHCVTQTANQTAVSACQ